MYKYRCSVPLVSVSNVGVLVMLLNGKQMYIVNKCILASLEALKRRWDWFHEALVPMKVPRWIFDEDYITWNNCRNHA